MKLGGYVGGKSGRVDGVDGSMVDHVTASFLRLPLVLLPIHFDYRSCHDHCSSHRVSISPPRRATANVGSDVEAFRLNGPE